MADNNDPIFNIQRVYLKEASLEQPNSPAIFLEQAQPAVEINLHMADESAGEGFYEVAMTVTVTAKVNDRVLFLAECREAGIFEIRNIPEEQMENVLKVICPQIIYPYLRGNLADMTQRAGFPPVHLTELNFQAMYEQQKAAEAGKDGAAAAAAAPGSATLQ